MTAATTAVERYSAAHRAFAGNGAGGAPSWIRDLRDAGIKRFAELGFPSTKQEAWRFTSVSPIADTPFALAPPPAAAVREDDAAPFLLGEAAPHRIVFVNGRWDPALSRVEGLPPGVRVASLARAVHEVPDAVRAHVGGEAGADQSGFRALNDAFLSDGAFVHLGPRAVLEAPLQVLYLTVPAPGGPTVTHPRTLVVAEREARAAVVETYAAVGEGAYWTNAVTELVTGEGAQIDTYRVQREGALAYHVATTESRQERDSVVNMHAVAFGSGLARHDIAARLGGPGGRLVLNGLYLLRGRQHADHHTTIDHAAPHCESHEYFNGVLEEQARSVFTGRILVRPGAQRTDSKQTNNNLLLSGDAHADSQPQLEIYADDVKCTHGSTVGPLDARALFYLQSRGLDADAARRLLTYGFGAEILGRMEVVPLRDRLDAIVRERVGA